MRDALSPPASTPEYMVPAWASCLRWTLGNDEALAAFRAATGNTWEPGRTRLELAIDEAAGADRAFLIAFVAWFNEHVWGEITEAPT